MQRSQVFPSKYFSKADAASPRRMTISHVTLAEVGDNKDQKPLLNFSASDNAKPLIINNGNWSILEDAYGIDSDMWAGKPIEVYHDPSVMYCGKRTGGIRVRLPAGAAPVAPAAAPVPPPPSAAPPAPSEVFVLDCGGGKTSEFPTRQAMQDHIIINSMNPADMLVHLRGDPRGWITAADHGFADKSPF